MQPPSLEGIWTMCLHAMQTDRSDLFEPRGHWFAPERIARVKPPASSIPPVGARHNVKAHVLPGDRPARLRITSTFLWTCSNPETREQQQQQLGGTYATLNICASKPVWAQLGGNAQTDKNAAQNHDFPTEAVVNDGLAKGANNRCVVSGGLSTQVAEVFTFCTWVKMQILCKWIYSGIKVLIFCHF